MTSLSRLLTGLLAFAAATTTAQVPMTPLWQHTWPFGQGPLSEWFRPLRNDNHVTVDPVTERLHVTIDDSETSVSDHQEFHYQFDLDGNDLTPQPVPLMGTPVPVGPVTGNAYWTKGLVVHGDRVNSIQAYMFNGTSGQEYLASIEPGGQSRYVTTKTLDYGTYNEYEDRILTDGSNTVGAYNGGAYLFNEAGWVIREMGGIIALYEGIVYSAHSSSIRRYLVSDGSELPALPYSAGSYVPRYITVDGDHIYVLGHAFASAEPFFRIAKLTLDGTLLWTHVQPVSGTLRLEAMTVDPMGRCWVAYNLGESAASAQALILVLSSDGTDNELYTFGAGTNSMVRYGDRIYMTGRVSVNAPDTYLAAFGTDVSVGQDDPVEEPRFDVFPNPASEQVRIRGTYDGRVPVEVHDARGALIATYTVEASGMVDISALEPGCYFMTVQCSGHRVTRRINVVR